MASFPPIGAPQGPAPFAPPAGLPGPAPAPQGPGASPDLGALLGNPAQPGPAPVGPPPAFAGCGKKLDAQV